MTKKVLSVGFADLSNFNRFLLKHGTGESVITLNEAFQKAGDIITKNNGVVRKYMGDSILFTLDDPSVSEKTARDITQCFRKESEGGSMVFRVSIATGEVIISNIGHPTHRVEDIFGITVNNAALQIKDAANSPTGYILCEQTKKYQKKK